MWLTWGTYFQWRWRRCLFRSRRHPPRLSMIPRSGFLPHRHLPSMKFLMLIPLGQSQEHSGTLWYPYHCPPVWHHPSIRNRLAVSLGSRYEEQTQHKENKDEALHGDWKQVWVYVELMRLPPTLKRLNCDACLYPSPNRHISSCFIFSWEHGAGGGWNVKQLCKPDVHSQYFFVVSWSFKSFIFICY